MATIAIDEDLCVGCETCCELCPEVFEFDEVTQVAKVINPEAEEACVQEAIDSCPEECIHLEAD
jgi:ferredoxin